MSKSDKSGKPELSNDELTRISKEAYSRYTGYDGTAMSIGFRQGAEWVYSTNVLPLRARIAELEAQTWPKWNKISDGLPDNGLLVNYFTADGLIGLGYCYMSSVNPDFTPMWSDLNDENPIEKNITHWIRVTPPNNFLEP